VPQKTEYSPHNFSFRFSDASGSPIRKGALRENLSCAMGKNPWSRRFFPDILWIKDRNPLLGIQHPDL